MARRAGRVLVAITCCLSALGAGTGRATAASTTVTAAPIPPRGYIVADAGTGEILESLNDQVPYPPASITKVMTALTAVERLPPDATITVSALAASQPASKINMLAGQRWTLTEALTALLVVSANDAAYAIAQATSGSIAAFAQAETVTGQQLGLRDSTFNDPAGLDDGDAFRGGPLMSAYDVAISTDNALRVPLLARLAASPSVSFVGPDGVHQVLVNHNKLVSEHLYPGATGFKTGFTNKADHTFIGTATRNGRTLIVVILGTGDAYGWAERLLDAGFATAPGHGTGQSLPAPRITTYASRAAELSAFRRLVDTSGVPRSTPRPRVPSAGKATRVVASSSAPKAGRGGVTTNTRIIVVVIVALVLAILYLWRWRAVRRARARRLARRDATNSMMRRGALPVVDGRYRTGTRIGKPEESEVQIRSGPGGGDAEASG
jgi:D-alanyl-D-alanine carboxypeptidase (penicillin-binding protein 5/6)